MGVVHCIVWERCSPAEAASRVWLCKAREGCVVVSSLWKTAGVRSADPSMSPYTVLVLVLAIQTASNKMASNCWLLVFNIAAARGLHLGALQNWLGYICRGEASMCKSTCYQAPVSYVQFTDHRIPSRGYDNDIVAEHDIEIHDTLLTFYGYTHFSWSCELYSGVTWRINPAFYEIGLSGKVWSRLITTQ